MTPEEARKQVRASKPREGFLIIQFGYSGNIVLPHSQGIKLMEALTAAELYDAPYNDVHRIKPVDQTTIQWKCLSADEYEDIKVSALLNIKWNDFVDAKKKAQEQ